VFEVVLEVGSSIAKIAVCGSFWEGNWYLPRQVLSQAAIY